MTAAKPIARSYVPKSQTVSLVAVADDDASARALSILRDIPNVTVVVRYCPPTVADWFECPFIRDGYGREFFGLDGIEFFAAHPEQETTEQLVKSAIDDTRELVAALPQELFALGKQNRKLRDEITRKDEALQSARKLFDQGCVDRGYKDEPNWIDGVLDQIDAALAEQKGSTE